MCAYAAGVASSIGTLTYPEVLPLTGIFPEGARTAVTINAYERNAGARTACIAHYGTSCAVCEMNFETVYGPSGKGLIHVHHLKPLASIGAASLINPIADLAPCARTATP